MKQYSRSRTASNRAVGMCSDRVAGDNGKGTMVSVSEQTRACHSDKIAARTQAEQIRFSLAVDQVRDRNRPGASKSATLNMIRPTLDCSYGGHRIPEHCIASGRSSNIVFGDVMSSISLSLSLSFSVSLRQRPPLARRTIPISTHLPDSLM